MVTIQQTSGSLYHPMKRVTISFSPRNRNSQTVPMNSVSLLTFLDVGGCCWSMPNVPPSGSTSHTVMCKDLQRPTLDFNIFQSRSKSHTIIMLYYSNQKHDQHSLEENVITNLGDGHQPRGCQRVSIYSFEIPIYKAMPHLQKNS